MPVRVSMRGNFGVRFFPSACFSRACSLVVWLGVLCSRLLCENQHQHEILRAHRYTNDSCNAFGYSAVEALYRLVMSEKCVRTKSVRTRGGGLRADSPSLQTARSLN